jgi:hypothetical protein
MLLRRDPLSRLGRLILIVSLGFTWCLPPCVRMAFGQATQPSSEPDAWQDPQQRQRIAEQMERDFAALQQADQQIPRDTFDPAAIVKQVGRDPAKLAGWVRDNTFFVPYRGALRGASGVLMDRLGSNLDRALLLAELLRLAGHEARLARRQLGDEQAKGILSKLPAVPEDPVRRGAPASGDVASSDTELADVARQHELDVASLRSAVDAASMSAAKLSEEVIQQTAELKQLLVKSVGKPNDAVLAQQRAADEAERVAAISDAWWVQVKTGDAWSDQELMNAEPAQAAEPVKTIAADRKTGAFPLEPADCHEIIVRVIVERSGTGKDGRKEQTALTRSLRPYELHGLPITLANLPMAQPQIPDVFADPDAPAKIRAALLQQNEWLPALFVGKDLHAESSFTDAGELEGNALVRLQSLVDGKALGSSVGNILGSGRIGGMGGGTGRKSEAGTHVTAEWIEYDFCYAGRSESVVRREVFDLVGPDARARNAPSPTSTLSEADRLKRALMLAGHTSILLVPCRPSGEFFQHVMLESALSYRKLMPEVMRNGPPADAKAAASLLGSVKPICAPLYFLAAARHAWSSNGSRIYIDRPDVFTFHQLGSSDSAGNLGLEGGFDIVSNRVGILGSGPDAFSIRLEQGVLDTCIEAALGRSDDRFDNAADVTARAAAQSIPCDVLHTADNVAPTMHSADIKARLKSEVAAGQIVLAPHRPIDAGGGSPVAAWWQIDPRTGTTLGMGDRGWGQTASEYFIIVVLCTVEVYMIYLSYLSCRGQHGPLRGWQNARCSACAFFSGFCTAMSVYGLLTMATGFGAAKTFQIVAIGIGAGRGGGVIPGPSLGKPAAGVGAACAVYGLANKLYPSACKIK